MKYGIIMPSRDRADTVVPNLIKWIEQDLPIAIVTEPDQTHLYRQALREADIARSVRVLALSQSNAGLGNSRRWCTVLAHQEFEYDAFIMADDDVHPKPGHDVRKLLDFVAAERAMGCAGWMPPYGQWVPDGNNIAKEPNLVVPTMSGDRIYALNTELAIKAGNFNPKITVTYENVELMRQGARLGHLWYIHSGVHTHSVGKRDAPGGLVAYSGGTPEARHAKEVLSHQVCHDLWPAYITQPPKRYSCQWRRLVTELISPGAADALKTALAYVDDEIDAAYRQWPRG